MEERISFVSRLRDGERLSDLCREFGISRKTGHKIATRYKQHGVLGLVDQRRVPRTIPHRTSTEMSKLIVGLRRKHPTWGPKKLQEVLRRRHPDVRVPAISTIGDILARNGLITRKRRRRHRAHEPYPALSTPIAPNDVWCIDYKGEFRMRNGRYCYPLTVTDAATRYILVCDAFESISGDDVRAALEEVFRSVGMPTAIRFDGGSPFASSGLLRLSKVSAWWTSLGIRLEQIEPASPQQNGRHERMHRTLKAETTRPPAARLLQQQQRFDKFVETFNHERPHEAIAMKRPADLYVASKRSYAPTPPQYAFADLVVRVAKNGSIRFPNGHRRDKQYFLSESLVGHDVGLRELNDGRWQVTFCHLELGVIDRAAKSFTPTHCESAQTESPRLPKKVAATSTHKARSKAATRQRRTTAN